MQLLAIFVEFDLKIGSGRAGDGDIGAERKYRMLRQFLCYGVIVGVPCMVADDFELERIACLRDACGLRRTIVPLERGKVLDGSLCYEHVIGQQPCWWKTSWRWRY